MLKKNFYFLILVYLIKNSSTKDNLLNLIELKDLTKTRFSMINRYVIFAYENNQRVFDSSINFIFDDDFRGTLTKVCIYDSFDKINMIDYKFYDCLEETILDSERYIKISYDDYFYKDNCIFYLALYDSYETHSDFIYVVNSLKYLNFEDEITKTLSFGILFNFLIKKDFPTYLHYRAYRTFKTDNSFYINITNEKGKEFVNNNFSSVSDYIKIEPNVNYYAHIKILSSGSFSLKYKKYKNSILLKDENEAGVPILSGENYTFFRSLSNYAFNEPIIITGECSGPNSYSLYVKNYEPDDFESLFDSFPNDKKGFDSYLGAGYIYGSGSMHFSYDTKKINQSQKGILIGFFVESRNGIMDEANISLSVNGTRYLVNENHFTDNSINDKSPFPAGWIILIVIISLMIVVILIWIIVVQINKRKQMRENLLQNDINNVNNKRDRDTLLNPTNDNYNSTSHNGYDNKILPDDKNIYDNYDNLSACPAINKI